MQTLRDANDTLLNLLPSFAALMSGRPNDAESDGKTASQRDEEIRTLRSVQQAPERRSALVVRKWNTIPAVNTLPRELLVKIFAITIDNGRGTSRSVDHATLSLGCHYWNHLVNTTPSLWTKIQKDSVTSMAKIVRALEKSQNTPLEITYNPRWNAGRAEHDAFLNAIRPHAHRRREVTLWLVRPDQGLNAIATLSTPILEDFSLSVHVNSFAVEPLNLFGGRPSPRLRKLYLEGIPVQWSPTILCHLTSLGISRIRHLGPSLDQVLAVLSACPDLESLYISEVSFSGSASTPSPDPIHMPVLRSLELCDLTVGIANRLLAFIHAPGCLSGELDCYVRGDPLQTLFTSDVSHFADHTRSNRSRGLISRYPDDRRFSTSLLGPWRIRISVENITFAKDTLLWLSPQCSIELTTCGPNLPRDELLAVADVEAVNRIALHGVQVSEALPLLAPCSSVQGRTRWLFPGLVDLKIWIRSNIVGDDLDKLLLILRVRQGAPETQDDVQRPKPLRKLKLGSDQYAGADDPLIADFSSTYWPDRLDEVRRLLGPEGELMWYGRIVTEEGVLEDRGWFQD